MAGKLDHFTELWLAEEWARVGALLAVQDPLASRLAWRHAATSYKAYNDAWNAHLPASRWDYDYGEELADAEAHARKAPVALAPSHARPRLPLVDHALEGRMDEAATCLTERPTSRAGRALARIVASYCDRAGRGEGATRIRELAKEPTLSELGLSVAAGVAKMAGEVLSHLDYPPYAPRPIDIACVTMGVERDALWRGVALLVDRGPVLAAYVPGPSGSSSTSTVRAFDLEAGDTSGAASAVAEHVASLEGRSPETNLVNLVCDCMQVLWGNVKPPSGRWLPRFSAGDEQRAWIDLDGRSDAAWPGLVAFTGAARGVLMAVEPAYGASGLGVTVASPADIIAASPPLLALVRTVIDRRVIARAAARGT